MDDFAVMVVENQVLASMLTAMDNVVLPRVELVVKSITESSGRGPNSMVQLVDQRNFSGNAEKHATHVGL